MKKVISILSLGMGLSLFAQVGIKTGSPKAWLDVNGDLNLRGKLMVLNYSDGGLSEGTNDQILVSQGEGYPPVWRTLRIPEYEPNKFYLIYNNSFSDKTGITFNNREESITTSRTALFTKGNTFSNFSRFKKIPSLSQPINIYSTESKTYIQFETVVQANFDAAGSTDTSIDYACGIFIDDRLISLRQRNLKATSGASSFITHNQVGIVENLSKGQHAVSVACARMKSYNTATDSLLGIGINVGNNINSFITQSSIKVDVYEVPQVFNTIID
ncbi:hypothetical protein [Chryseobacterium sp.]|uniref:hypothetical protein n=1 Tax=Chryseobacterium sp. TaxID=1871047 RepID=UPI0025BB367F|nr:hypothetical protein [Chryseobacterium sp.]